MKHESELIEKLAPIAKDAKLFIRAFNHPVRQRMLKLMANTNSGELDVTTIYKKMNLEQSVASQQLAIMRDAKLVIARRDGKNIYYSVNTATIKNMIDALGDLKMNKTQKAKKALQV